MNFKEAYDTQEKWEKIKLTPFTIDKYPGLWWIRSLSETGLVTIRNSDGDNTAVMFSELRPHKSIFDKD